MKIFCICLIKNEADIIRYSLSLASNWAEKIFVYDNGSSDGTWEIVNDLAKTNPKIIPWKSEAKPFRDGLRAEVYNQFKHLAQKGDWWCCRLDGDEFYIDNPREILKKIKWFHHVVTSLHFEYRLTFEDIQEYNFSGVIPNDLGNIKFYNKMVTSETRFFRHRDRLEWDEKNGYPKRKGIISPIKIRIKHYQYRSPSQIQARVLVRKKATEDGYKHFGRDNVNEWEEKLEHRENLIKETPEYPIGYIADPNGIPWYWYCFRMFMHLTKLYP